MMRTAACDNDQTVHYSCVHVASCFVHVYRPLSMQGEVTPTDSVVTTATTVGQWSMVKAAQKGVVNGQGALKNTVNADNSRS